MAKLTPKQERFCEEYLVDLNATQAALRAGYKSGDLGRRLVTKSHVSDRISELKAEQSERTQITADRVLEELAALGFSNMLDYVRISREGDAFVDLSETTREQAAAIQEVTVEDFVDGRGDDACDVRRTKFKLADKKSSLELLGKHLRLFTDRVEHSGPGGGPIRTIEVVDDNGDSGEDGTT